MALSAVAQAANGPTPASPNPDATHQKVDIAKKMELLKKRLHAKNPALNFANFPGPASPAPQASSPHAAQPSPVPVRSALAENGNPYASIVTRNVFGLNPPAPVVADTPPGPPPPKITLTGITTIFGPAEALYKVSGVPQPGKPPKDESYILKESEGQDDVVVERIDVAKGIVTFNNHGVVQDIPLAAGVASGGTAGTGGSGGGFQPPRFGGFGGQPNYNNAIQNFRQRLQQQRMGNQNGYNPSGQNGFNGGYNNNYNPNSSTPQLSPDDQAALIAAQHAQLQNQGNPAADIFPPTKYDPEANQEAGGGTGGRGNAALPPPP
jgi:hypothetical protein